MDAFAIARIGDETFGNEPMIVGIHSLETTAARLGT